MRIIRKGYMIQKAMSFVAGEVNAYIRKRNRLSSNERMVVISNLVNPDGSLALKEENKIVLSLVNIQKETVVNAASPAHREMFTRSTQPHFYNIFILFSAYFKEGLTEEGIRYLSQVLTFFQSNPYHDHTTAPALPAEITKLVYDYHTLSFSDLSNLWGSLGAKYLPSALFRVSMLTVQEGLIKDTIPVIKKLPDPETDNSTVAR